MKRVLATLGWMLREFGSLVVFYVSKQFVSLRWAIALSTLYAFAEIGRRLLRKEPFTGIFKFSVVMTVLFGAVDLWTGNPTMFKYEAAVSNLATAAFFGGSLLGRKSVIQEFYEKRPGARPMTRALVLYFRGFTIVWVLYFVAKAAVYAWVAHQYGMDKAVMVRLIVGNVSLYALLGISILGGRSIFMLLLRWGVFKQEDLVPAEVEASTAA